MQHCISACKNVDDLRNHDAEFLIYPLISEDKAFVFTVLVRCLRNFGLLL